MKLLILAQTPPPLHGQSLMVQTAIEGLPERGIEVHHVNLRLSRSHAEIGGWHLGKVAAIFDACFHAVAIRFLYGCDTLYYVPAPGQRSALYRDWLVMVCCRPFFRRLVLHWHAAGLADWLQQPTRLVERQITRWLLTGADLAIVIGQRLGAEADYFGAKRSVVVRNGVADPCAGRIRENRRSAPQRTALYIGLLVPDKGVDDAIAAVDALNDGEPRESWRLVLAGEAPDSRYAAALHEAAAKRDGRLRLAGFVSGAKKTALFDDADVLLFPTYYGAETQGLVVAEALAHDLPAIVTDWRGVAENLPPHIPIVPIRDPRALANAMQHIVSNPPPRGQLRRHFLEHYSVPAHLDALARALRSLEKP